MSPFCRNAPGEKRNRSNKAKSTNLCNGKYSYKDRITAMIVSTEREKQNELKLFVYQCHKCKKYHLSKQNKALLSNT